MVPILLLEINEVPWRLLDRYSSDASLSNLRQFLNSAHQFTTMAVDIGELSPWVTWPTFHRGMNNELHGIKNLGQDSASFRGKPIWQDIREAGGTIGICGSLQSWPPIEPGEGGFYIPDTFAHDERCHPTYVEVLQAFNLLQVRKNARVITSSLPTPTETVKFAAALLKSGVRLGTIARVATQLIEERINVARRARRPVFQTVLFWDVFRRHFNPRRPPDFSTFFTNHIAGVMHRYWNHVFPEDFPEERISPRASYEWLMRFALRVLDDILGDVMTWSRANPDLVVVFASSMGQAAIHRDHHEGVELVVEDLALLMSRAGIARSDYRPLLAMAPQVAVEIADSQIARKLQAILEGAYCGHNRQFIKAEIVGQSLSITVRTPPLKDMADDTVWINNRQFKWADAGIRKQEIEPGTGYHVPHGCLAVYSERIHGKPLSQSRSLVNADRIKNWMLRINHGGPKEIESLLLA